MNNYVNLYEEICALKWIVVSLIQFKKPIYWLYWMWFIGCVCFDNANELNLLLEYNVSLLHMIVLELFI